MQNLFISRIRTRITSRKLDELEIIGFRKKYHEYIIK